MMNHMQSITEL